MTALWLLAITLAVSYGWGMRGTLLGHGAGALLPGALLGIFIAFMSGNPALAENFAVLGAFCAVGMYFGGGMTYGQIIGYVLGQYPPRSLAKGFGALAFMGAVWFGIAGAALGLGVRAVEGAAFLPREIAVLAAIPVLLYPAGVSIFNRPFDPQKKIFPKIYFSQTRAEDWGGYLLMLLGFLVFFAAGGDRFSVVLTLVSALGGALGWFAGIWIYLRMDRPREKSGKYLFGRKTKYPLDGWKAMECTLGAFGGLFTGIGFLLAEKFFPAEPGAAAGGSDGPILFWAAIIWVCLALLLYVLPLFKVKIAEKPGDYLDMYLLAVVPLILLLLGAELVPPLLAFLITFIVCGKMCFDKFADMKHVRIAYIFCALICAAVLAAGIFLRALPLWVYLLILTALYIGLMMVENLRPGKFSAAVRRPATMATILYFIFSAGGAVSLLYLLK